MTWVDLLLQRWRIRKARRELPAGARLLDIGTYDGTLFRVTRMRGVGIDPALRIDAAAPDGVVLVRGAFATDLPDEPAGAFDAAAALAVVEHVPEPELEGWSQALARLVRPGGVLVITVPSPAVDNILHVLIRLHLVGGMEAHQHHGFEPDDLVRVFAAPAWQLVKRQHFQLGLNNLFVFRRDISA